MRILTVVLVCAVIASPEVFGFPQGVLHSSISGSRGGGIGSSSGGISSSSSGIGDLNSAFTTTTTAKPQIPIVRHINRVNNDGSYTFGYESGDGSYRVETRGLDGVIQGRYGYIDENGVRKEVDYSAGSANGYEPRGQGITVPPRLPPRPPGQQFLDYDDGSGTSTARTSPIATRTRARQFNPQPQPPPPPQPVQTPPPPPPPPPPQPQITITEPEQFRQPPQADLSPSHDFSQREISPPLPIQHALPSQSAPLDFSHRQINPPSPPQPVFRQPQRQSLNQGASSPIEQFLSQQQQTAPQQQQFTRQPQQHQPLARQLF